MLRELYVENFALIDNIRLFLPAGLTALTGETGAGKSLIIDAVALLIGGKASEYLIRDGSDKCFVEGVFSPPYTGEILAFFDDEFFDAEDDLIISREYSRNGRNTCRINSRSVNLSLLRNIGRILINIHGQMEHMLLLEENKQLELLDNFAGEELLKTKDQVEEAFNIFKGLQREVTEYDEKSKERSRKIADLRFQIDEIKKATLEQGEEEKLLEEKTILIYSERLLSSSNSAYQLLRDNGEATDKVSLAINSLKEASEIDEKAAMLFNRLNDVYFSLEDIAQEILNYAQRINDDPLRLEEIENRLFLINNLKKKYGKDINSILGYFQDAEVELVRLEEWDINSLKIQKKLKEAEEEYYHNAKKLSELRQRAADKLSSRITDELKLLYMPASSFRVDLIASEALAQGLEKAAFMICSNQGEKYQPVNKIASGGELSRIVLAIKVVLAELEQVPTLIFDEVDSGLGGKALSAVAKRMALVGEYTQSLLVTHAPLMAAAASHQISISKAVENGRTVIKAKELDEEERVEELARMIAGEKIGEATLLQARELLK